MKLSDIKKHAVNTKAVRDGEWKRLADPFSSIEILTKGITDVYRDAMARRLRKAAKRLNVAMDMLPNSEFRKLRTECMIEFCWIDVRGITEDDGKTPLSFDKFIELLRNAEENEELYNECCAAAENVGRDKDEDLEEAKGN